MGYSFLWWPTLVLGIGALACGESGEDDKPPIVPGQAAYIHGLVMRGNRPMAGVHALARITYGAGCNVKESAPGGTTVLMTPTDSTGRFQATAYPASVGERRAGCLYVGAVDTIRAETAWAAPRPAPVPPRKFSPTRVPIIKMDVPWPE